MDKIRLSADGTPRLVGSRDQETGQTYFPYRPLAADGSLRPCEEVLLSGKGALYSWTRFAKRFYGQIDLPEGVRVQCEIDDGPHEIGGIYRLEVIADGDDAKWRFRHD
ncbi:MAG: hypothetical protein KDK01_06190 [Rhodobacteraceae bacterium]|jgi:uncharacterized OB-fold protein|nr:hypothetical protein [Paracoccaceae bacterium]